MTRGLILGAGGTFAADTFQRGRWPRVRAWRVAYILTELPVSAGWARVHRGQQRCPHVQSPHAVSTLSPSTVPPPLLSYLYPIMHPKITASGSVLQLLLFLSVYSLL